MSTFSSVQPICGTPTLLINGAPHRSPAYMTYLAERGAYGDFAAVGCRLFSASVFFGSRGVNASGLIAPFEDGVFENPSQMNLQPVFGVLDRILRACPDGKVLLRVNTNLPAAWDTAHPGECNDIGTNGQPPRVCFASRRYADDCEAALIRFIYEMEQSDYADCILGYQIAGGNTEEWLSFDNQGNNGPTLRAAFLRTEAGRVYADMGLTDEACKALLYDAPAFRAFASETVADLVARLARAAKKCVQNRKVIGAFYGYAMETPWWQIGHCALTKLLQEPAIDFLCAPLSYRENRKPGIDFACMTLLDTVKQHGKLYFAEADVRTHLSKAIKDCRANACAPGSYLDPIWFGPKDERIGCSLLKAVYARALTHGYNLWWFDMWGGWYRSDNLMQVMADCQKLGKTDSAENDFYPHAELVMFTDEKSVTLLPDAAADATATAFDPRIPLGHCGAPYDVYDVTDFPAVAQRYKAALFAAPMATPALEKAIERWAESGKPYRVSYSNAPLRDATAFADLCRSGGVHLFAEAGDVVYAGRGFVALHAATAGQKTLRLPAPAKLIPIWPSAGGDERIYADRVEVTTEQYETLLYGVEIERI